MPKEVTRDFYKCIGISKEQLLKQVTYLKVKGFTKHCIKFDWMELTIDFGLWCSFTFCLFCVLYLVKDNYFEEALKMRNLLEEFHVDHGLHKVSILGVREHVFTGRYWRTTLNILLCYILLKFFLAQFYFFCKFSVFPLWLHSCRTKKRVLWL